ncbi:Ig-like domain-containing protein, partial [Exiguobacterium sp. B2(2022)]|uniref:Ig-like domain-containing protein n=1 Tax=Exiguobacterium sp. B2(2022) TaxID=2992755 RepID=UPI00237A671E
MAKKSFKLVKASAALAVTAAALTPVMAAEASTSTVELKAEVVLGGKFKEALALNTPAGVEIKWGKYLVTAINKWQTVKGQGSDGKTYIKKLYARNYPLYILDQDLGEVEAGSELEKPSIRVMYRDGKVYTQAPERFTMSSTYNTKDEGEQKVLISYNHNGNRITSFLTYTVVAGEVEFDKVMSSVDQAAEVLSVTADVKNLKEGEKVELVVYPGKDMSAQAITETATVKDGKLTVSKKLPAGTHSFQLVSGEVKSEIQEFTIEAPMVKEVKAINAKEVIVKFNKAVKKDTVLGAGDAVQNITFTQVGTALAPSTLTGKLSADGMELTILAAGAFDGSYAVATTTDIKTVAGAGVAKFESVVSFEDSVRPTVSAPVYKTNNVATISFSEPVDLADNTALANALTLKDTSGATFTPVVALAADKKSFTLDLNGSTFATNKAYQLTIAGVKDFAGNLITPNPVTVTVEKKVVDEIAPTVSTISSSQAGYVVVNFSEQVADRSGNLVASINGIS